MAFESSDERFHTFVESTWEARDQTDNLQQAIHTHLQRVFLGYDELDIFLATQYSGKLGTGLDGAKRHLDFLENQRGMRRNTQLSV